MNTNELVSMIKEAKNTFEKELQNLSEEYFTTFKEQLTQKLKKSPWMANADKIGLPIFELTDSHLETGSLIFLYEDQNYEDEHLTSLDDYDDLIFGTFAKENLLALINHLKDYGFKLFVNEDHNLVPFMEIN